jgi:hypothetical protein
MPRGGARTGAGRKSRKLETGKISAYIQDRELLNQLSVQLDIPVQNKRVQSVKEIIYRYPHLRGSNILFSPASELKSNPGYFSF